MDEHSNARRERPRDFKAFAALPKALIALVVLMVLPAQALAVNVSLIGVFPGKGAVVVIDGAAPRSLKLGQKTAEGVLLVSVDRESALVDIEGQRKTLRIGQHHVAEVSSQRGATVSISSDSRGQFIATAMINNKSQLRMLVDTGASSVTLSESDAQRLGISYRDGPQAQVGTANGATTGWKIKLASVKLGDVVVNGVDAIVLEGSGLPVALLGMTFLDRFEMNRDGASMVLKKRF